MSVRRKAEREPWIMVVAETTSHVERRPHLWCKRCGERMVTEFPINVTTYVEVMRGFQRAHLRECRSRTIAPVPHRPPILTPDDWLAYGEIGASSRAIFDFMTAGGAAPDIPRDPDDFRRCHELLGFFPAWRSRMPELGAAQPSWCRLTGEWERLTALYVEESAGGAPKLWEAMKALEHPETAA